MSDRDDMLAKQRLREQRRRLSAESREAGYSAAGPEPFASFVVVSVHDDHVMARRILPDGRLDAHEVPVGKPWWLRRSSMDGREKAFHDGVQPVAWSYSNDRRRTATRVEDEFEIEEVLTPDFILHDAVQVGEVIEAIRTKVWMQREQVGENGEVFEELKVGGQTVAWRMIGDGRVWAQISGFELQ